MKAIIFLFLLILLASTVMANHPVRYEAIDLELTELDQYYEDLAVYEAQQSRMQIIILLGLLGLGWLAYKKWS